MKMTFKHADRGVRNIKKSGSRKGNDLVLKEQVSTDRDYPLLK